MVNLKLQKPETYMTLLNWAGVPLIILYMVSMFVFPFIQNKGDWPQIQNIWDRWQGLNIGMLAFISSLVAFNISKYNAEQGRRRNFVAARSFLPEAFSELTAYCRASMAAFDIALRRANDDADRCNTALTANKPDLPKGYRQIFSDCIKVAEPDVGDRLSKILMLLQIQDVQLNNLFDRFKNEADLIIPQNIFEPFYCIAEIQALINKTFNYARGLEKFNNTSLTLQDFQSDFTMEYIWSNSDSNFQKYIKEKMTASKKPPQKMKRKA